MIYQAAMRGAAGASTFSPDDIAGLQLWLDASDETTITASSGAVSQWDDKSGNGNHVSQGTAAAQPTTGTRTLNAQNVIDFDGTDNMRSLTSVGVPQPWTSFVAVRWDAGGGTAPYAIADRTGFDGLVSLLNTDDIRMFAGSNFQFATSITLDAPHVVAAVYNGASSVGAIDGSATTGNPGTNLWNLIRLGSSGSSPGDSSGTLDGFIAEVLVYDSALSTADRETVESYLASKWGVTLS